MKRHHHLPAPPDDSRGLPPQRVAASKREARRRPPVPQATDARYFADFLAAAMTLPPELLADFEP